MAASLNIVAEQYSSYTLNLTLENADGTPMDLVDTIGTMKIARISDNEKVLEFSGITGVNKVQIEDAANGKIKVFIQSVELPPITSTDITKDKPDYYYTLTLTKDNIDTRVLDGLMSVSVGIL